MQSSFKTYSLEKEQKGKLLPFHKLIGAEPSSKAKWNQMPGWNQVSSFCSSTKPENLRFYLKDAVQESELEWCISLQSLQFIFNLKFVQSCSFKFDKASFFCGIIHHTSAEMVFLLVTELRAPKPELVSLLSSLFRTTEEAAGEEQHFSSCWECLNLCNVQKLSEKAQAAATVWQTKSSLHLPNTLPEINIEGGTIDVHHKNQHPGHKPTVKFTSSSILMLF